MLILMREVTFVDQLQSTFDKEGFLTQRELGAGYGVADLVLVRLNDGKCAIRMGHGQNNPLLRQDYFRVLKHIPDFHDHKEPISIDDLSKKSKTTTTYLRQSILKHLESEGYIQKIGNESYLKINGWVPIAKEVIAIEAKIKDWKRGFLQANRYKAFADKVYLAIPIDIYHLVDLELLKRHNVGLITFDCRSDRRVYKIKPKKIQTPHQDKRNFISEFFWQYSSNKNCHYSALGSSR